MCSNSYLPSFNDEHRTSSADRQPVQEIKAEEVTSSDRGSMIKEVVDRQNSGCHYDSTVPSSSSSSNMKQASVDQSVDSPVLAHDSRGLTDLYMGCLDIPPKHGGKIIQPSENDVLNGRGGAVYSHPGNITYRKIVNSYRATYLSPTVRKLEKMTIAAKVVSHIRSMNGRFLIKEGDYWYEIGDAKARRKAGQAMRENGPSLRKILMNKHEEKQNQPQIQYHEQQVSTQPVVQPVAQPVSQPVVQSVATYTPYVSHQGVMDYSTRHASNVRIAQLLTQARQEIQQSQQHLINTDQINGVDHTVLDTYGIEYLVLLKSLRNR